MSATSCNWLEPEECAARYVARRLTAAEQEEFELHLLECTACRGAVREAATIRSALRLARRRRLFLMAPAAGVAAAAVVAWLIVSHNPLRQLGRIDAPELAAMDVRAGGDSAAMHTTRALAAYRDRRWREAARWFARSYADASEPGTAFFMGVSYLLGGEADSSLTALAAVLRAAPNPYANEARLYSAKAWLRKGVADSAVVQLRLLMDNAPPSLRARARALGDSINTLR